MLTTFSLIALTVIVFGFTAAAVADRKAEKTARRINEVVFLMGNPAAGKSTMATKAFGSTHKFIDCDQFKMAHPEYDPKNPAALHAWSAEQADAYFGRVCTGGKGLWVMDGTGANLSALLEDIAAAREAGFTVSLFYVACSLETSLRRNAARERVVPAEIVMEKASKVEASFHAAKHVVDYVTVIDNDRDM